jgi:hypothetical protein
LEGLFCYYEGMGSYKKYSKEDQKLMATWAIDCAERVLPLFESVEPKDDRPKRALKIGRDWIQTGIFSMPVIREASLDAHAAAKAVKENDAACFAAHAAGQAVATAHVPQHAYGGSYYALKAIAASNPLDAEEKVAEEVEWQTQALPDHLRDEIMGRIVVDKTNGKLRISISKGEGF